VAVAAVAVGEAVAEEEEAAERVAAEVEAEAGCSF